MTTTSIDPAADDGGAAIVGDLQISWEAFGRRVDPTVLLVMGLGSQLVYWDVDWCRRLADRGYYVIRYDHRDIGCSSKLDELGVPDLPRLMVRHRLGLSVTAPYSLDALADDAAGLLTALERPGRAHLVGVSMGGMVAQLVALRHGAQVASLCSWMSTPGERADFRPKWRAAAALLRTPPRDPEGWAEHIVGVYRAIGSPGELFDAEDMRRRAREAIARSRSRVGFARHLAAILASPSRTRALGGLSIPTLVLHGDQDPLVRPAAGRATAAAVPGSELVVFDGVGHDMPRAIWPRALDAIEANLRRAGRDG
jgi:pimeloyl-ACP methyl ester carboxylesterase